MSKNIYLFTNSFPYGEMVESFLVDEMPIASNMVDLTIIPLHKHKKKRNIPDRVAVWDMLNETGFWIKSKVLLILFFSRYFYRYIYDYRTSVVDMIKGLKYLYGAFLVYYIINKHEADFVDNGIFYSYWFNHTPFGLVLAKEKNKKFQKFKIITRAHGYDVYEKERGVVIPFRAKTLSEIDQVYVISEYGRRFLMTQYPEYKEKISCSKLGVPVYAGSLSEKKSEKNRINVVSCSSVNKIKRVDLIYNSLNMYSDSSDYDIVWTHLGKGPLFEQLKKSVSQNDNAKFKIKLLGYIDKTQIQKYYYDHNIDVFVNLSETEGIPVSIMEAISVGIPVIATNVGGTAEIVKENSGILLEKDFDQQTFNRAMDRVLEGGQLFHEGAFDLYKKEYDSEMNYKEFYNNLL